MAMHARHSSRQLEEYSHAPGGAAKGNPLSVDTTNIERHRAKVRDEDPATLKRDRKAKSGQSRSLAHGVSEVTHRKWAEAFQPTRHNFRVLFLDEERLFSPEDIDLSPYRQPGNITLIYQPAANLATAHGLLHQMGEVFEPVPGDYPYDNAYEGHSIGFFPLRRDDPVLKPFPLAALSSEAFFQVYDLDPVLRASITDVLRNVGSLPQLHDLLRNKRREDHFPLVCMLVLDCLANLTQLKNVQLGRVTNWDQILREWVPMVELYSGVKFVPCPNELRPVHFRDIVFNVTPSIVDYFMDRLAKAATLNIRRRLDQAQADGAVYLL